MTRKTGTEFLYGQKNRWITWVAEKKLAFGMTMAKDTRNVSGVLVQAFNQVD